MNLFRDAATLAVLLLLALTVRVDLDGKPLDVDLASNAEAAPVAEIPEQRAEAGPVDGDPGGVPTWVVEPDLTEPAEHVAAVTVRRLGMELERIEHDAARELVFDAGDRRVIVVLETDVAPDPLPSPPAPTEPCGVRHTARLSC